MAKDVEKVSKEKSVHYELDTKNQVLTIVDPIRISELKKFLEGPEVQSFILDYQVQIPKVIYKNITSTGDLLPRWHPSIWWVW